MAISSVSLFKDLAQIKPITEQDAPIQGTKKGEKGAKFGEMLTHALSEVDSLQKEADQKIGGLALGKPGVTPHDAMIALEKADVAFQLMSAIRGKIIRAYEEVLRTQI